MLTARVLQGDCRVAMKSLPTGSIDAIICDPPYPEVDRDYGRLTEVQWLSLMQATVREARRVLKPRGSAVFVLQPNQEVVGKTRPWLFDFQAWSCREWNMVQDIWWWNFAACPTVHCQEAVGLTRGSLKACVWLGDPDCLRYQSEVLWTESQENSTQRASGRCDRTDSPSGHRVNKAGMAASAGRRGGVTPFNVLPFANTDGVNSGGAHGHGAATPRVLCNWWIRYLTVPGDTVLDPFCGSGTVGLEALDMGRSFVGIEQHLPHYFLARARVGERLDQLSADPAHILGQRGLPTTNDRR